MHMPSCDNDILRWLFVLSQGPPPVRADQHRLLPLKFKFPYQANLPEPLLVLQLLVPVLILLVHIEFCKLLWRRTHEIYISDGFFLNLLIDLEVSKCELTQSEKSLHISLYICTFYDNYDLRAQYPYLKPYQIIFQNSRVQISDILEECEMEGLSNSIRLKV